MTRVPKGKEKYPCQLPFGKSEAAWGWPWLGHVLTTGSPLWSGGWGALRGCHTRIIGQVVAGVVGAVTLARVVAVAITERRRKGF